MGIRKDDNIIRVSVGYRKRLRERHLSGLYSYLKTLMPPQTQHPPNLQEALNKSREELERYSRESQNPVKTYCLLDAGVRQHNGVDT